MTWQIPYFELVLGDEEKRAILDVLNSNWLTSGPQILEFEAEFARRLETPGIHALAVSNCTAALHLSLEVLGIQAGDEVICPSLTFVATANAIRYTGATPVFADICSETEWNISPPDIEAKITENTKAIMVVHYGGYPCQMAEILALASKYDLRIIEDACHGPLAEWNGAKLGTIGDFGCLSFFSNKNMTTGEGGMILTKHSHVVETIKALRSHGMTSTTYDRFKGHAFGYDVTMLGYNYRMDELRAAIGIEQIKKLPEMNRQRRTLVEYYRDVIQTALPDLTIPFKDWRGPYGYHIFPVLLPEGYTERNRLMTTLAEHGIQTSIHYRPVHSFTAYEGYSSPLPVTETIAPRILSLPFYPTLKESQINTVVATLNTCLNG